MSAAEDPLRDAAAAAAAPPGVGGAAQPRLRVVASQDGEAALWAAFAGAESAGVFCESWLALQCRGLPGAECGLLLLTEGGGRFAPAAVWPDRRRDVKHLAALAQKALSGRRGLVEPAADPAGAAAQVAYPIELDGELRGAVVVELRAAGATLQSALREIHWGSAWLEALLRRNRAEADGARIARLSLALEAATEAGEHPRLRAAATAVATSLAVRLGCRRVAIGLLKGRGAKLVALSHAAWFEARAGAAAALEQAMEEALDQDAPVCHPPVPATERRVSAAAADLARLSGAAGVAVVPVLSGGRPVGALTFEREGEGFAASELEELAAVGAAVGPVLDAKAANERLVSGRIALWLGDGLRALFGPRRPTAKLAALAVAGLAAWLALATGEFRVTARAALEGSVQRAAVAPFDGFVALAPARAGDVVEEGQLLAQLDDREMALEAARRRAEREQLLLRHQEALGKQDRAQARILLAQLREAEAQLALVEGRLERARIRAPFRGVVVSGDLSQQLGAPVETGRVLFEVAPLENWRVVLRVDERDLRHVAPGQGGRLVPTGMTQESFPVAVTRITPVASVQEGRNAFRVEASVVDPEARLRPGMEGVVKLSAGERNLAWIWTRSLLDWARLQLWTWLP